MVDFRVMRDQKLNEKRVLDLSKHLQNALDLGWVVITHKFSTRADSGERIIAETACDWEYRQATILWNLPQVAILTDEDLEVTMIHELVHVMNASLWESLPEEIKESHQKLNEFATENMARALMSALHPTGQ